MAQTVTYPETLLIPVTFYDFHADGSNPEFEQPMMSGSIPGLVAAALDAQHKPKLGTIVAGSRNVNVEKWFRPWAPDGQIPSYSAVVPTWGDAGWSGCSEDTPCTRTLGPFACSQYWNALITYNGMVVGPDTAFKNMVFQQNLIFNLVDAMNGTYEFDDQEFFPLDGMGFGNDALYSLLNNKNAPGMTSPSSWLTICKQHNFSFTMEMQFAFTYKTGQIFSFIGDDDLWVFINDKLALDVGGIHSQDTGRFRPDSIAAATGLVPGNNYLFSLFYAKRQTPGSHLKIMTNLTARIGLYINAGDEITAGQWHDSAVSVSLRDIRGNVVAIQPSDITWQLVPASAVPGDSIRTTGLRASLYAERAWREVEVRAAYKDPATGIVITCTRRMVVSPAAADHIVIEDLNPAMDSVVDLNHEQPLALKVLLFGETNTKVAAVQRDPFQNFVSLGRTVTWGSLDNTKVAVLADADKRYIGLVIRGAYVGTTSDTTYVTASQSGLRPDSVKVAIQYEFSPVKSPIVSIQPFRLSPPRLVVQISGSNHYRYAPGVIVQRTEGATLERRFYNLRGRPLN